MIKVTIEVETDKEQYPIGQLRITNLSGLTGGDDEDEAEYIVEFALAEGDELALKSRRFSFWRKEYNAFALIKQAVHTLTEEELRLNGKAGSADMAWGQQRIVKALQDWESKLRHH